MNHQTKTFLNKEKYNTLKSQYLEENYKNDLLTIEDIEYIDESTIRSVLKVKEFTLDKENRFHLSSVTALAFAQQLSIVHMLLDMNKTNNNVEFYTTECLLKMSKPISSKSISLESKIISSKIKNGYKIYNVSANFENNSFFFTAVGIVKI